MKSRQIYISIGKGKTSQSATPNQRDRADPFGDWLVNVYAVGMLGHF